MVGKSLNGQKGALNIYYFKLNTGDDKDACFTLEIYPELKVDVLKM